MTVRQPRYSKEEFARHGNEIYESQVRAALQMLQGSQVENGNYGKIVAIDNQATPPQADGVWKQICSRIPDSDCKPVVFAAERRGIYPY